MALVRDYLDAHAGEPTSLHTIEQLAGLDRFALARQFRRAGRRHEPRSVSHAAPPRPSPGRDPGRDAPRDRRADAGFADQSHLTRQFKRAHSLTPPRWVAAVNRSLPDWPSVG
jgi:hypothetical protein